MRRRLLPLLAVVALVGVACGDDSEPAATQVGVRTAAQAGSWVECENAEEGYVLSRPADWHVGDEPVPCGAFDPEPDALDSGSGGSGDVPPPAVLIEHRDVPFDQEAAGPPEGEDGVSTAEETIDGRDAVRHETRAGEASSFPAGTRVTRWTVDLRADRTLVATTTDLGDGDYGTRQEVLDRIVTSIDWVEPGATGEGRDPVGEPNTGPAASGGYPRAGGEPALLADVRAESHEGFDRIVVELTGAEAPSYRVAPVEPPIERDNGGGDGTGAGDATAPVAGEAFVEIRLSPASVLDASGSRTYEGPDRIPVADGAVVTEVVRTGGTDGPLTFAVGLTSASPFAVGVLDNPTRLVVDIVPGG